MYLVSPLGPPERKVAEISRTTGWPRGWLGLPTGNGWSSPTGIQTVSLGFVLALGGVRREAKIDFSASRESLSIVSRLFHRMAAL